jgi:hypothetical protein
MYENSEAREIFGQLSQVEMLVLSLDVENHKGRYEFPSNIATSRDR